jgi:ABC-2 type transport system ATP-binding protein
MISLANVTKKYGFATAVDRVSLTIEEGEFCALLGPNGAGKTTCMKMLLDFVRPTSGSITLGGQPASNPCSRSAMGYLAETCTIPGHLSARKYLRRHAALCGLAGASAHKRIDEMLELTGMKAHERSPARTCSKGMVQRIGLAAALLHVPRILLLDEPASGLDPIGMLEVRLILEKCRERKVTMLLSSHLLSEVEKLCSTAAILNRGKLVLKEPMDSLLSKGDTLEDIFMKAVGHESA